MTNVLCNVEDCNNQHYCKGLCRSHYNKKWRQDNYEEYRDYDKQYKEEHKADAKKRDKEYATTDNGRFKKAKSKAKVRGLEFDIYFEDFVDISNRPCFYCADELCGKEKFQGAHLDRIDNSLGYTLDNVISCGILCNRIRMNNLTVAETKDAVDGILAGRKRRQNIAKEKRMYYYGVRYDSGEVEEIQLLAVPTKQTYPQYRTLCGPFASSIASSYATLVNSGLIINVIW